MVGYWHWILLCSPIQHLRWSQCTSLWRETEYLKAVLKAELCFYRYVLFACVPIYIFGLHQSLKDETRLLLLWVGSLETLHIFVFNHIKSVVKPVHFFMTRNRIFKSLKAVLIAELCFHRSIVFHQHITYIS